MNVVKQQVAQAGRDMQQGIKSETQNVLYEAQKQVTGQEPAAQEVGASSQDPSTAAPNLPPKPEPFDSTAYRTQVDAAANKRIQELREQIVQIQNEQMDANTRQAPVQEQAMVQDQTPVALRGRGGSSEARRGNRKG